MRIGIVLIMLSIIAGTPGAEAARKKMWVDAEESVDFSKYRSYNWKEGTPARRPEVQQHIVAVVNEELGLRGLTEVDETEGDLLVLTHAIVDRHTLEELDDAGYWEFWTGVGSVDAYDLRAGTLVIDFVDAKTHTLVWRGVANETVKGSYDRNLKKLDKLVRKLLEHYPPATDGGTPTRRSGG